MAEKKYVSQENLQLYDSLIKTYISTEDAKSIKTIVLEGKTLKFYRVSEPVGSTAPAYTIELPETDVSGLMAKISGGTVGDVLILKADGSAEDSGVKLADLATKTLVEEKVAEAISQAAHMKKSIVAVLPDPSTADENTFYLIKDETATGSDKYEIYIKIGNEMVMIDDTSVNMDGYYSKTQIDNIVAEAKQAAIDSATSAAATDATSKANKALADAKSYTDTEIGKVNTSLSDVEGKVETNITNISNLTSSVSGNSDRITALEASVGEGMVPMSETEIRALFS